MNASHLHRWLTAAAAVPALFILICLGSEPLFAALIGAVIFLASWEYEKIISLPQKTRHRWEFLFSGLVIALFVYLRNIEYVYVCTGLLTIILMLCDLFRIRKHGQRPDIGLLAKYVLGLLYIPVFMSYFILIRGFEAGATWVIFILVLAFSGDAAAFYAGRSFGKTKLLPAVSPNKTVEGVIGLVAGSLVASVIFRQIFFPDLPLVHILCIAFWGSIIGQLGDLFESEIKRSAGVKDSGNILPGHGGILDRVDCLLFIGPFVYYYVAYIVN